MAAQYPSIYSFPERKEPLPMAAAPGKNPETVAEVRALLCELRELLDTYGPAWYEESHYERITAAVALLGRTEANS